MMAVSLLPPNTTPTEAAFEAATARLAEIAVPVGDLWNPATCPSEMLPWLAWALSIDDWDAGWADDVKRAVLTASVNIHRHKGTVAAIRTAISAAGLQDAALYEHWAASQFDGTFVADGSRTYAQSDHWAEYRIELNSPIALAQASRVRLLLSKVAPARCHLKSLQYPQAENIHNHTISYDGTFSYGVA